MNKPPPLLVQALRSIVRDRFYIALAGTPLCPPTPPAPLALLLSSIPVQKKLRIGIDLLSKQFKQSYCDGVCIYIYAKQEWLQRLTAVRK